MKKNTILFIAFLSFVACRNAPKDTHTVPAKDVVASSVDTSISPTDDFFQFANGGWFRANPIPPSESSWGIGKVVQEDIYQKMRKVNEAAAANTKALVGSNEQKIGDFWATGMDTVQLEKLDMMPLMSEFAMIESLSDKNSLLDLIGYFQTFGMGPLFGGFVYQDLKNSNQYAYYLWQGGLGLPERDYYFNTDARNLNIRKEYVVHITNMFKLMGIPEAEAKTQAETVFAMETFLAKSHRKIEDLRDQYRNYNKMAINDIQKLTPSIDWKKMMEKMAVKADTLVVGQPEFFKAVEEGLSKYALKDWQTYMKWQVISSYADKLSKKYENEHFNFYGKILEGKKEQKNRWKRVLDAQESALGDALGQLFVKEFFPEKAKKRYTDMVEAVKLAYAENIQQLDWMSDATKFKALDKLKRVSKKVGYPEKWKDFSNMTIDRSSYVRNSINASKWWYNYNVSKLGKPVNRDEWDMTPQTYNAYYNPSNNEIVLPAGIFMIPGYADDQIDDAVAYGYAAASTIGHEITHGFDDQGRQYDAEGNLVTWWLPEDSVKFTQRAEMLVRQFNEYVAVDTMHVRGSATLGENIADLGGVVLGLKAFMKTDQYKKGEKIDGYTPLQRYFLGYALGWQSHQTKERLAQQIMTDVHAPAKMRVNGPFVNIPEFYEAFGIKEGSKMWREPAKRVRIW